MPDILEGPYRKSKWKGDAAVAPHSLTAVPHGGIALMTMALKDGRGSFAHALIAALATRAGCQCTLTFDKRALRLPGFELP